MLAIYSVCDNFICYLGEQTNNIYNIFYNRLKSNGVVILRKEFEFVQWRILINCWLCGIKFISRLNTCLAFVSSCEI